MIQHLGSRANYSSGTVKTILKYLSLKMCIVVKESYMWVYGGILNYSDLVGQILQECREVQGLETLASIFQKTWENRENHMGSCGWARAEENQSRGQNVLLVPWVAQIPLLFWEGFGFRVSFP